MTTKYDLDTPMAVIDLDIMERNIDSMAEFFKQAGVGLRPHIKTHKIPEIADLQIKAGAVGITCAKLSEAEVMAEKSTASDLFIAYQIVGAEKIRRLIALSAHSHVSRLSVGIDSVEVAQPLSEAARRRGIKMPVLIKVDVGQARTGVAAGKPTVELGKKLVGMPGLELSGIYTHEGQVYDAPGPAELRDLALSAGAKMAETAGLLRAAGIEVAVVSVGATPSARLTCKVGGITESRPGTYVFNDGMQMRLGTAEERDCALTILATVISVPTPDRAVIDAGSKTVTTERASLCGAYGVIKNRTDLHFFDANEEHGMIQTTGQELKLKVGDKLEIIPNHVCAVMNLHDEVAGLRGDRIETIWKVAARGKIR
jgi:D-serine deaminase-like pyridoxal phosphate-dependent protein